MDSGRPVAGIMRTANIIIDANIVLHYRRIDEIDWPTLTAAEHCDVIIVPALMRELERKKITASNPTLRKRAGRAIDFLVKRMDEADPIELRSGCNLVFRDQEPLIDFESERLDRVVDDDQYIASAIEIAAETDCDTYIATADGGMKLKVRSRPIKTVRPPEDMKLTDEPDPETLELREAKKELERLKTASAKPTVTFESGETKPIFEIPDRIEPRVTAFDEIKRRWPILPKQEENQVRDGAQVGAIDEVRRREAEMAVG